MHCHTTKELVYALGTGNTWMGVRLSWCKPVNFRPHTLSSVTVYDQQLGTAYRLFVTDICYCYFNRYPIIWIPVSSTFWNIWFRFQQKRSITELNQNHASLVTARSSLRHQYCICYYNIKVVPPIEVECGFSVVSGYLQCSTEHRLLGIFSAALKIYWCRL